MRSAEDFMACFNARRQHRLPASVEARLAYQELAITAGFAGRSWLPSCFGLPNSDKEVHMVGPEFTLHFEQMSRGEQITHYVTEVTALLNVLEGVRTKPKEECLLEKVTVRESYFGGWTPAVMLLSPERLLIHGKNYNTERSLRDFTVRRSNSREHFALVLEFVGQRTVRVGFINQERRQTFVNLLEVYQLSDCEGTFVALLSPSPAV